MTERSENIAEAAPRRGKPRAIVRGFGPLIPCLVLLAIATGPLPAQDGVLPDPAERPPEPAISEVRPEIWYLRDASGSLLPAPGFRYEDFVELMRLRDGLPVRPRQPDAVLERIALDASIEGRVCRIEAVCEIDCTAAGWTSAFLALDPLVLDASPVHDGQGRFLLEPLGRGRSRGRSEDDTGPGLGPAEEGGYRAWFERGGTDGDGITRQRLRLSGIVPVERSGSSESIRLTLPRATTSVLRLRTTLIDPVLEVRPDRFAVTVEPLGSAVAAAAADPIAPTVGNAVDAAPSGPSVEAAVRPAPPEQAFDPAVDGDADGGPTPGGGSVSPGGNGSLVTALGLSGPVEIRMSARGAAEGPVDRPAQVVGEVMVRIDGRKATSDVALSITGLSKSTVRLKVRLPRGAAVTSARPPSRYLGLAGTESDSLAEFAIPPAEEGSTVLAFTCESRVDASGREAVESLAYAVDGIAGWRQWGRASVTVDGDWQVDWEPVPANRRVDPPERTAAGDPPGPSAFAGAFAYDSQPASMPLRVRPLGSRMAVEPEYRYAVGTSRIELDARLRLSVRGAPMTRLEIALPGWAIDDVGPAGLVDTSRLSGESGRLLIPFVRPLAGNATIELRAGRTIDPTAASVDWALPLPRADLIGPAAVTIVPQTNIELVPDADRTIGLVRQVVPQPSGRPAEPGSLTYRMESSEATFQASRRFLDRRLDAAASIRAVVDVEDTLIEEIIRLDVAYLPLEIVRLAVPRAVLDTGTLEIRHNGLVLSAMEETESSPPAGPAGEGAATASEAVPAVRAVLPVPLLGSGELRVRYALPTPTVPPETTIAGALPLVLPIGARLARQSLAIEPQAGLTVDVRGDQWKRDLVMQGAAATRSWTSTKPQAVVPLAIATEGTSGLGEAIVEAAWFTTRVLSDRIEDRFRYRVASAAPVLTVTLPADSVDQPLSSGQGEAEPSRGSLRVYVDGRATTAGMQTAGRLSVELAASSRSTSHIVEIERIRPRPRIGEALRLAPPTFEESVGERRFFWELRIESDDHVLHAPASWNSQQAWRWTALGPVREPVVSQGSLHRWLFGSAAEPMASLAPKERRSVYSGIGPPGIGRILLAPSWLVVLVCSGPLLAALLALEHVRRLQRPLVAVSLAGVGIAAAAVIPDQMPLIMMASLPGLVLGALSAALRGLVDDPSDVGSRPAVAARAPSGSSTRLVGPVVSATSSLVVASSIAASSAVDGERSAS